MEKRIAQRRQGESGFSGRCWHSQPDDGGVKFKGGRVFRCGGNFSCLPTATQGLTSASPGVTLVTISYLSLLASTALQLGFLDLVISTAFVSIQTYVSIA